MVIIICSFHLVIYRHFDTMIFPDAKAKVEVGTVKKFLLSYVPAFLKMESNDPTVITVPTPLIMRSKCMEIHLEPKRKLFTSGKFKAKFTIQDGIDGILGLFEDIYVQFIEQGLTAQKWCIDGLKPVSLYSNNYYIIMPFFVVACEVMV